MVQIALLGSTNRPPPRRLYVVDDYGPVGQGASAAHTVLAENGSEYLIKGPALTPGHFHVAANELIAADLASLLNLPVLDRCIIDYEGDLCFASSLMEQQSFENSDEHLFARIENRDRVYELVVLDTWIANQDRHNGNLLVRRRKRSGQQQERVLLLLNDHSHCLVLPGQSATDLVAHLGTGPCRYVMLPFVRAAITDAARLTLAIDAAQGIGDDTIRDVIEAVPRELLPEPDRALYEDFLLRRRGELRALFAADRFCFTNLEGAL